MTNYEQIVSLDAKGIASLLLKAQDGAGACKFCESFRSKCAGAHSGCHSKIEGWLNKEADGAVLGWLEEETE